MQDFYTESVKYYGHQLKINVTVRKVHVYGSENVILVKQQ